MSDAKQPAPIQRVLVVTAHPDDSEFGAGGTVARLAREGKQVSYCIVTNGNKGSGDRTMTPERLAGIRAEEQRNAARVLGVETVDFLGFPDCEVEDTRESRMAVTNAWKEAFVGAIPTRSLHSGFVSSSTDAGSSSSDSRSVL